MLIANKSRLGWDSHGPLHPNGLKGNVVLSNTAHQSHHSSSSSTLKAYHSSSSATNSALAFPPDIRTAPMLGHGMSQHLSLSLGWGKLSALPPPEPWQIGEHRAQPWPQPDVYRCVRTAAWRTHEHKQVPCGFMWLNARKHARNELQQKHKTAR